MNKRIKQLWIDELRSGKYKQCYSTLKNNNNEFCVIGILFNIIKYELKLEFIKKDDKYNYYLDISKVNLEYLSNKKYDYSSEILILLKYHEMKDSDINNIIIMNDSDKLNFDQLATYIESYL